MRKKRKLIYILLAAVLLIGLGYGARNGLDVMYYKKAVEELSIESIDLSRVKDGTYTGSCDARLVAATVKVTVVGGKITDIKLMKHKNDRGKAGEAVVDEILKQQKPDVDAISGATNSSRIIMKAVENALEKGVTGV
ncbi:FMN-binding protein [Anoxybacterium hadale]|uniref:FMN-binding protein n=1 Tax=Anoxybacterium hadale TaxID=3408580 RepID=A0ACD1A6N8_9FIRM|nr:FMN-binding protein [Clostridiales bacterium]